MAAVKRWEDYRLPSDVRAAGTFVLYNGTVTCVLAAVLTLIGYLQLWSVLDLVPAAHRLTTVVASVALGFFLFRRGEQRRWDGQLVLSRLNDDRRRRDGAGKPKPVFGERVKRGTPGQITGSITVGGLICGSGAFTISACFLPPPGGFGPVAWWSLRAGLVLLGVFEIFIGNTMLNRAVRLSVGVIPSFAPLPAGSYVLYLRNFSDDRRLGRPQRVPGLGTLVRAWFLLGRSEEKRIAAALGWAGPVVAVGVPGERTPNDGILRMDLPGDWQGPVRTLVTDARLVVLVLGAGPGTLWELGEAMRVLRPERLVLMNRMKSAEYEQFREQARRELRAQADELRRTTGRRWKPPELPELPADRWMPSQLRGIIHFSGNWQPTYVPLPRVPLPEDHLLGALDRALWGPMVRLTAYERRIGAPHGNPAPSP